MKLIALAGTLLALVLLLSMPVAAQSPVTVRATDPSTGVSTNVGDAANNAFRINCITGCSSGTTDTDDGSIAGGQTSGVGFSMTHVWDGVVWRRFTIGTAGTPTAQVLTVQGIASMTKLLVTPDLPSGAATSANQGTEITSLASIDGKITAVNTGAVVVSSSALPTLAATSTKQSDGTQKTQIVDGSGNVIGATSNALDINIKSGNPTTITATQATGTDLHVVADSGSTTSVTGNVATTVADGANVVLGAKADAKSTATDTTAVTIMSVLKEISAMEQAPASRAVTNGGTFATQSAITAASGSIASGAIASGAVASGAVASGAVASGAYASGAVSDGAIVTLGNKTDAKSTATDGTSVSAMQVLKEISAMAQSPAALPANQSVNVAQVNGVTTTTGNGVAGTGVQRVSPATDAEVTSSNGALGALNDAVTVTIGSGNASCGVAILVGTLAATVTFEQTADGSTWSNATIVVHATLGQGATAVFTNPNATSYYTVLVTGITAKIRVRVSSYTSGTATAYVSCTPIVSPFALNISAGLVGQVVPLIITNVGGTDGTNVQRLNILNTAPTSSTYGAVVRPVYTDVGNGAATSTIQRVTVASDSTGTTTATQATGTNLHTTVDSQSNIVSISGQESVAAPFAATWYIRKQWALPASAHFTPTNAWAAVTTALTKTTIAIANNLGNLNVSTNTFTAGNSVASPFFYSRLFGCVTTVLSATPDNLTVTYTDELGASSTSGTVTFAASTSVGNCFEFPLATGTIASGLDSGVRAVTNVTDTAATTGVVTIYGVNIIADFAGTAAGQTETQQFPALAELNANEQIMILMMQAATTAQLKTFGVTGILR